VAWAIAPAHLFGWLLTVVAASLGAPFWFDTLNRFMNSRAAVPLRMNRQDRSGITAVSESVPARRGSSNVDDGTGTRLKVIWVNPQILAILEHLRRDVCSPQFHAHVAYGCRLGTFCDIHTVEVCVEIDEVSNLWLDEACVS